MAFYSDEATQEVRVSAAQTVLEALRGSTPRNLVN
jgi:hypothetical protein